MLVEENPIGKKWQVPYLLPQCLQMLSTHNFSALLLNVNRNPKITWHSKKAADVKEQKKELK